VPLLRFVFRVVALCYMGTTIAFLGSCTQEIVLTLPEQEPKLVLLSYPTTGQRLTARLSVSANVEEPNNTIIPSNAKVTVYKDGVFEDSLRITNRNDSTYWESKMFVEQDVEYSIRATADGFDPIEAQCKVPNPSEIEHLYVLWEDTTVIKVSDDQHVLRLPIQIVPKINSDIPPFFAFGLEADVTTYLLDSNGTKTSIEEQTASFNPKFIADGRTFAMMLSIPEPVIMVHENFWDTPTATLQLDILIPYNAITDLPTSLTLEWRSLSKEFYKYHLSLSSQNNNSPFAEPNAIYTNVNGGIGVFAGYTKYYRTIKLQ
jgi:hypothetical protein